MNGPEAGARPGGLDTLFVAGAVMAAGAAVVVGLLVFVEPAVSRLGWAFALSVLAATGCIALVVRRAAAREVAKRWALPMLGLALGLPYIGVRVTWSVPEWWILLLPFLFVVAAAHLGLLCMSTLKLRTDWRVGLVGFVVVGATWASILGPAPDSRLRRARVELAAPDLVIEAQALLDEPLGSGPRGPFVATSRPDGGRVVGWQIGFGMLGNGQGLIWDPDGVLRPSVVAVTTDGYPWGIPGDHCEIITDGWLLCSMQ